MDPGVSFDENRTEMVNIEELIESDMNIPEDARTAEELRKITNTVFICNKFTNDCLSSHEEGMAPVLELQLRRLRNYFRVLDCEVRRIVMGMWAGRTPAPPLVNCALSGGVSRGRVSDSEMEKCTNVQTMFV